MGFRPKSQNSQLIVPVIKPTLKVYTCNAHLKFVLMQSNSTCSYPRIVAALQQSWNTVAEVTIRVNMVYTRWHEEIAPLPRCTCTRKITPLWAVVGGKSAQLEGFSAQKQGWNLTQSHEHSADYFHPRTVTSTTSEGRLTAENWDLISSSCCLVDLMTSRISRICRICKYMYTDSLATGYTDTCDWSLLLYY